MMPVKYHICLFTEEQQSLKQIVQANNVAKHKRTQAQILLALDEHGPASSEATTADENAASTVQSVRKRCVGHLMTLCRKHRINVI